MLVLLLLVKFILINIHLTLALINLEINNIVLIHSLRNCVVLICLTHWLENVKIGSCLEDTVKIFFLSHVILTFNLDRLASRIKWKISSLIETRIFIYCSHRYKVPNPQSHKFLHFKVVSFSHHPSLWTLVTLLLHRSVQTRLFPICLLINYYHHLDKMVKNLFHNYFL